MKRSFECDGDTSEPQRKRRKKCGGRSNDTLEEVLRRNYREIKPFDNVAGLFHAI